MTEASLPTSPEPQPQPPLTPPVASTPSQPEQKKRRRIWPWLILLALIVLAPLGVFGVAKWWPHKTEVITPADTTQPDDQTVAETGELRLDLNCDPTAKYAVVPYRIDCSVKIAGKAKDEETETKVASPGLQMTAFAEGVSTAFPAMFNVTPGGYKMATATSHFAVTNGSGVSYLPPATTSISLPFNDREATFSYIYAGGAENDQIKFKASLKIPTSTIELSDEQTIKLNSQVSDVLSKGSFYYDVETNKTTLSKGKEFDLKIDIAARQADSGEIYDNPYQGAYVFFYPASAKQVDYDKTCEGHVSTQTIYEFQHWVKWTGDDALSQSDSRANCQPTMKPGGYTYSEYPYAWFPVLFKDGVTSLTVSVDANQKSDEPNLSFVVVPGDYSSMRKYCPDSILAKECSALPALPRKPADTSFLYGTWMADDSLAYKVFTRVVLPIK